MLAIGIILIGKGTLEDFWMYFQMTVLQAPIFYTIYSIGIIDRFILLPFLGIIYEIVALSFPFYFVWRKRTVFSAWLVAMADSRSNNQDLSALKNEN